DGIRGRNVTGVQTCALPIWYPQRPVTVWRLWFPFYQSIFFNLAAAPLFYLWVGSNLTIDIDGILLKVKIAEFQPHNLAFSKPARSEERRVGKECRAVLAVSG